VWIPNAFTPDGDGRNEGLRVATNCDMLEFSLTLYNRWGEVIWEITDPESPWDGGATALGEGLHYVPDGIYPYVCRWAYTDNGILLRDQRVGTVAVLR
jgi:gliding motility-associated-like protein